MTLEQTGSDDAQTAYSSEEIRVLGVLIEKAILTPDLYPLSMNGLIQGCNQSTSREPVTDYGESEVSLATTLLRDKKLVYRVDQAGARVAKYEHRLAETWDLGIPELALLCVLFLRGPQTVGQLRQRTERLYGFRDLEKVRETLDALVERDVEPGPLVVVLPAQLGTKERRYAHTLTPVSEFSVTSRETVPAAGSGTQGKSAVEMLLDRVGQLELELEQLRAEFKEFKDQF